MLMLRSVGFPVKGRVLAILAAASFALIGLAAWNIRAAQEPTDDYDDATDDYDDAIRRNAESMIEEGRETFRFDTFGSEAFFGETLQLHQAIQGERFGGVGPGVSPKTALAVGLKVDSAAIPPDVAQAIGRGDVDLDDPATTLALLQLNAVVGVTGFFGPDGRLTSLGVQCALCHSTVNNSFAPGIGQRLDGWANRDLNVGAVLALAPDLSVLTGLLGVDDATVRTVLNSWGPGKYDALLVQDGEALRPDGAPGATLIPPAFGLAGVNLATWTGWGSVTYWNAYVANTQMHGMGTFFDPRLANPDQFPLAAQAGFWNMRSAQDRVTQKLAALHFYQLSIPAPRPPEGSYDVQAARRGRVVFEAQGRCSTCHVSPLFTEPGWNMHTADEMGLDDFQSSRSPDNRYRTAPLRGLWSHQTGGFFHDGRFATLREVVDHYDSHRALDLAEQEKNDLIQYLLSL